MRLIILLTIVHTSLNLFALSYDGLVTIKKSKLQFIDSTNNKSYNLISTTSIISTYLNKLSDGDFISIEGTINAQRTSLAIDAVNYIGLKALLGIWVGDDSYCYNFTSFTEFTISPRSAGKKCAPASYPNYTYIVNPTSNSWVMLLSGERSSYVGDLKFNNPNNIKIELFDSETGDILRSLHLRK